MRAEQTIPAGGGPSGPTSGGETLPGRVKVLDRVYRAVAEASSASLIGVPRTDVKADVAERGAGITFRISSPLPVPNLGDTAEISRTTPVLDRARELQEQLQLHLSRILGIEVSRVALTITRATIHERRRVQ